MRAPAIQTDWRTWLDASLFPFKIFTVAAALWLLGWNACLSDSSDVVAWDCDFSAADFHTFANLVTAAYAVLVVVLTAGGIIQAVIHSWKAATWSISFAGAALVIGLCLWHFFGGYGSEYVAVTL